MQKDPYMKGGYYSNTLDSPTSKYGATALFFKRHGVVKVLDLGCGAGRHTLPLAADGFQVYGFDNSAAALKMARKLLKKRRLSAKLRQWDMYKGLPYGEDCFDAVFASRVMYQARRKDMARVIGNVLRVLRDGGYLFWSGPTMKSLDKLKRLEPRRVIEPGTTIALEGYYKGIPYHCFSSKEEVQRLLKGFDIIRFDFRGSTFHLLAQKKKGTRAALTRQGRP